MERVLTSLQMRNADRYTIDVLGVPENALIERAGNAVADEIIKRFHGGRVLVCVGKGNNGKDGEVIARILSTKHGFSVCVLHVYNGIFKLFENKFDIIVDCIFGTGLNRQVEGKYKTAIEKINSSKAFVVACDIPSGLNSDNGLAMGIAVKADITVAIQEYKLGHFLNDGIDYCGKTILRDIGISLWEEDYLKKISDADISPLFCERKRNVHKGDFGKVAIMGGSKKFSGSVLLSINGLTALKMGVGYVNLAIPNSLYNTYFGIVPECIFTPVSDVEGNIIFDKNSLDDIIQCKCIAFGMGIGVSEEIYKSISYLLQNYDGTLLLDADALNTVSKYGVDILKRKKCNVVLTPHIGEFSRLLNVKKDLIMSDIIKLSKCFASELGVILLLKSAVSIITDGSETFINITGTSGMAKGGSGDVLSGLTAGIMCRCGYSLENVAKSAYLFGKAGEYAKKDNTEFCMSAMDIVKYLPKVIKDLS